jgi:hypothetical protein
VLSCLPVPLRGNPEILRNTLTCFIARSEIKLCGVQTCVGRVAEQLRRTSGVARNTHSIEVSDAKIRLGRSVVLPCRFLPPPNRTFKVRRYT